MPRSDRLRRPVIAFGAVGVSLAAVAAILTFGKNAVAQEPVVDWQQSVFTEVIDPQISTPTAAAPPIADPFALPPGDDLIPPAPPAADRPLSPRRSDAAPATEDVPEQTPTDPFARSPEKILRSLSEIRVALDTPADDTLAEEEFEKRGVMTLATHAWPDQTPEAAAYRFCCGPLWYEDANLERCGYSHGCLQPVMSGTHFVVTTALLPYRFVAEPPCETAATKPFCPPGCRYRCCDNYLPPLDAGGSAAQAIALTGLIFLIP
ncbi:MAG: hypothetical protein WBC44_18110 [Planctomycetaceae bacterium]